jgi:putative endonuclease
MDAVEKRIVYILRSGSDPPRYYVGITSDIGGRLEWHNCGLSRYSLQHRPWSLVVSMEFETERAAVRFKQYLKSGSGRAFTTRHFPGRASIAHAGPGLQSGATRDPPYDRDRDIRAGPGPVW